MVTSAGGLHETVLIKAHGLLSVVLVVFFTGQDLFHLSRDEKLKEGVLSEKTDSRGNKKDEDPRNEGQVLSGDGKPYVDEQEDDHNPLLNQDGRL